MTKVNTKPNRKVIGPLTTCIAVEATKKLMGHTISDRYGLESVKLTLLAEGGRYTLLGPSAARKLALWLLNYADYYDSKSAKHREGKR